MPYRTFSDGTGKEWQVWDIVPRLTERRLGTADRRVHTEVIPFADRRRDERRFSQVRRAVLRGTYAHGWLCFDSGVEKRGVWLILHAWTTSADEDIDSYLSVAEPVRFAYGQFSGGEDDEMARTG